MMPPDVLSNLPDNVIDAILVLLPCKDVVRTSILSTKWRYHRCRLSKLTLDESVWRTPEDLLDPTVKFKKITDPILTHHEVPITKFKLNIPYLERSPNLDNFINFLSRNGIQHLFLHLPRDELYKLPSSLFSCSQLRHLNLRYCLIDPPSSFKGFDMLISLKLLNVTIASQLLGSLISHCPLLEELVLETSETSNIIEINAPMMRSFDFTGSIACICLKNVPRLAKASLSARNSSLNAGNFSYAKFLQSCSALENLFFNFGHSKVSYFGDDDATDIQESFELESFSNVTFNHLKEVELVGFTRTMPQMQLIKVLLAKSPVLVRILINRYSFINESRTTRSEILAEISTLFRASTEAEVIYKS